jgi:hypothetical protein
LRVNARVGGITVSLATAFGCGGDEDGRNEATSVASTIATTLGTDASETATGSTGGGTTATSTTSADETQGEGPSFDVGGADTSAGACMPTAADETVCDGVDDDCNGFIDDIDVGGDGICDCLVIAIIGTPGSNPSSQFVAWLTMQGTSSERIDPALVDDTVLAPYDIVVLDQLTRSYTAAEATAFADWVDAGGGLMSMTGHTSNPVSAQDWPNGILGSFAIAYQGALLNGPVTDFLPHPITMGLTSVTFAGGFEVAETMANTTEIVAQLPAAPIARAREFGDGKVFVWGDEWIEYDSEWSTMPEIHQLWVNIFDWLRPADLCAPPPG